MKGGSEMPSSAETVPAAELRSDGVPAACRRCFRSWLLPATLALAALLCGLRLGDHGLHMWDETRHGEVAWEMLQTHDYLNYYYAGKPDDWLAKPPLGIWAIAGAYQVFGPSAWSLRLPSAVGGVLVILFTFLIVRLYREPPVAAAVCFVLMTCRGIVGLHVARTGDLDGMFVAALMGALYFVLGSSRPGKGHWLIYAAIAGGAAFYTKGFAGGLIVPGLAVYGLWSRQLWRWLKSPWFYAAAVIFAGVVLSWYLTVKVYGQRFENGKFGHDAWEIMTNYDIFQRFTRRIEDNDATPWSVVNSLDLRFGPWLYILALSLLVLAATVPERLRSLWRTVSRDDLLRASVCLAASVVGLLAKSATQFNWYVAPAVPFLAILTVEAARFALARARWLRWVLVLTGVGALGGQLYFESRVSNRSLADQLATYKRVVAGATHVYATTAPTYQHVLAMKFLGKEIEVLPEDAPDLAGDAVASRIRKVPEAGGGYSVVLDTAP